MDNIFSLLASPRSLVRVAVAPALAMLVLLFADLSSSSDSHADGFLFTRSNAALGQVWSGVLRCAVHEDDDVAVERALESGSVPTRVSHDYSECGRQALRNTGSRMIVNAVEDALYQGGLALFDEGFGLESSLQWVFGGNVRGEVDAVLPLWSNKRSEDEGSALFAQHGLVFWQGLGEESRTDGNFGVVFRSNLTSDIIAGGSFFYDYDFRRGHSRLGVGVDAQSGGFYGNFNYYHPLTGELEGREEKYTAYFERALRGLDATLAYRRNRLRLSGSLGYWSFEGEPGSETQWYPSYEVDAGFLLLPGVFVEGGYERHDDGRSLGSRWTAGMLFQFSLPHLDGAKDVDGFQIPKPDLWRAVEREKRILYEEYERGPGVSLRYTGERTLSEEQEEPQAQMMVVLSEALEEDIVLHLVGGGTARYGTDSGSDDWQMSYRIVPANETVRPNNANMTDCAQASESAPCTIDVPAGDTRIEVHVTVHDEGEYEDAETVRVSVVVPPGYARFLTARGATQEFTIGANLAPTVSLAYEGADTIAEESGTPMTANMEVRVSEALPRDIMVGFTAEGTADFGNAPNDWFFQYPNLADSSNQPLDCTADISNCMLTIPAGETKALITVNVNDDSIPEDPESLTLGITLPSEYEDVARLGAPSSQTVVISASERTIAFGAFDPLNPMSLETDVVEGVPVEIEIALDPAPVPITVVLESSPDPSSLADADADDIEFPTNVVIPANTDSHNFTVTAVNDGVAEPIEEIFLSIVESSRRPLPTGWSILRTPEDALPNRMRVEIAANSNTIVWDPAGSISIREDGGAHTVKLVVNGPLEESARLRLRPTDASTAVLQSSTGGEGDYMYSVTSGGTFSSNDNILEIPPHTAEGAQEVEITITPRDNPDADGDRTVFLEIRDDDSGVPSGWGIGTLRGTSSSLEITIVDDEPPNRGKIAFARSGSRVTEGTSFDIPISVTGVVGTTFNIMVTAHGATDDAKIQGTSGPGIESPHRFAVSAKSSNLGVDVADNTVADGNREIVFTLASTRLPPGVRFGEQLTHTLIIVDDEDGDGSGGGDILPVRHNKIGFASDSTNTTEGASDKTINVPVVASAAPANPFDLVVRVLNIGDNPAREGTDFLVPSTLNISSEGETNLAVEIRTDTDVETGETIVLELDTDSRGFPAGFTFGSRTRHTINIIANGNIIELSDPLTSSAIEGGEDAIVNITVNQPLPRGMTGSVNVETVNGDNVTAADYRIEGPGYNPSTGILRFPETGSVSLTVTAYNDTDIEDEESVTLRLAENSDTPEGWDVGTNQQVVTLISEYDAPARGQAVGFAIPGASETFNPVRIFEEDMSSGSAHGLTVRVESNEEAPREGIDLVWRVISGASQLAPASRNGGDIDFSEGDEYQEFTIMIESDSVSESPVPVTLKLFSPTGLPAVWSYSEREYTFTIESSDGTVGFASTDAVTGNEGETLIFEVTSDVVAPRTGIPVRVTLQGGTPADDLNVASDITIPAGRDSYDLAVEIISDGVGEEAEEYTVSIASGANFPVGWGTVSGSRTITIVANENTIGIGSPNSATIAEVQSGSPNSMAIPVTVSNSTFLANALANDLTLAHTLSISNDENSNPEDDVVFTDVVLDAGSGGGSASIEVSRDDVSELEEVVTATIVVGDTALPEGWSIDPGNNTYTVTIPVNGNTIGFASESSSAVEGDADGTTVEITIDRPLPSGTTASVAVGITNEGGAVAADYEITGDNYSGGILTLPVTPTDTATLTVRAITDSANETGEGVRLTLTENSNSFPAGWELGTDEHLVSLEDAAPVGKNTIGFMVAEIEVAEGGSVNPVVVMRDSGGSAVNSVTTAIPLSITVTDTENDTDFSPGNPVSIPGGMTFTNGEVQIAGFSVRQDTDAEIEERVTIDLAEGTGFPSEDWEIDTNANRLTIRIPAEDNTIGFASASSSATEDAEDATVNVTINQPLPSGTTASVSVGTTNQGGAVAGDYEITGTGYSNGIWTLPVTPAGTATLTVRAVSDTDAETGESVLLTLTENNNSFPSGWELGTAEHVVSFDEEFETVTIDDAATDTVVTEGNSANVRLAFSAALPSEARIRIGVTVDGTSRPSGYTLSSTEGSFTDTDLAVIASGATGFSFSVAVPQDTDSIGEPIELAFTGDTLPMGWRLQPDPLTRTIRVFDDEAIAVGFAESTLNYDTSVVTVNITSNPSTAFPEGVVLFVENSNETGTVIEAGPQAPLTEGQMQATLDITPLGGTSADDVVLTLTDPDGTLPSNWRIGSNDTLTLTRQNPPSANTINIFGFAGTVGEGGSASMVVEAPLPSTGGTAFPAGGIDLSLTVSTNLADMDDTSDDPQRCPRECVNNFEVSANLFGANAQNFKQDLPDAPSFPFFPTYNPTGPVDSTKTYTFTLTQEPATTENPAPGNPAANIFALIPSDIGVEPEETITVTLKAVGNLPPGWTLGTDTYTITVPANGERVGLVLDPPLPTVTREGFSAIDPATPGNARNWITLPFEYVLRRGTSGRVTVNVTGVDQNGNPVPDIYNQVTITDQVPSNTRQFNLTGNGRVGRTQIGIRINEDTDAELAQTLTITLDPGTLNREVVVGALTHKITVLPSDNTITFAQPSSASITQENGTATIGVEIDNEIPASGASPAVLIAPADSNGAIPDDYTLSVSGGKLETIAESGINTEKHLWTLPTGTDSATLTVTSNIASSANRKAVLALDFSTVTPLGWDVVADSGGTTTTRTVTLGGATAAGTVGFAESSSSTREGGGNKVFNVPIMVSAAPASAFPLTVNAVAGGTATEGTDFTVPATLSISESGRTNLAVTIIDDNTAEASSETIVLEIPASGHGIPSGLARDSSAARHTVTILPNDNTIVFAARSSIATEARTAATVSINIDRPLPPGTEASVRIDRRNSGGAEAADYVIEGTGYSNGILTLPETGTATLTVRAVSDFRTESGESVTLVLGENNASFPEGWEIGTPRRHVITLNDPPNINTVGFKDRQIEVAEGEFINPIVLMRDPLGSVLTSAPVNIPVSLSVTDPTNDTDFISSPTSIPTGVTFPNGEVQIDSFRVREDGRSEVRKEVIVHLGERTGFPSGDWEIDPNANQLIVVIPANENTITFGSPASSSIAENGGSTTITATINQQIPAGETATVTVTPTSANLTSGTDYRLSVSGGTLSGNTWTLPTGTSAPTLTVRALSDIAANETLTLAFAGATLPTGWTATSASHRITITDGGVVTPTSIMFDAVASNNSADEGDVSGDNNFVLDFSRALPVEARIAIAVSGVKGTSGTTDTSGYTFALIRPPTSSFNGNVAVAAAGTSELVFSVVVPEDADTENETITLTISEESPTSDWDPALPSTLTFTVNDNDVGGTIGIGAANSASITEVESGTVNFMTVPIAVSSNTGLASALASDITLAHTLSISGDENTDPGDDVVFTDVVLDATSGQGSARIEVSRDTAPEVEEVVTVTIMAGETPLPDGWTVDTDNDTYTVTIAANDNTITFLDPFLGSIAEDGGSTTITARINQPIPTGETATVTVTPTSADLTSGTDYSLSVSSGNGSLSGNTWTLPAGVPEPALTITALSDIAANATLTLAFAGATLPSGWTATDASHEITITDSATPARPTVGFVEAASTVEEPHIIPVAGRDNFITHNVQVRASQIPAAEFFAAVTPTGTATVITDYTVNNQVSFTPAGELTMSIAIRIQSDSHQRGQLHEEPEEDETIILTLSDDYVHPSSNPPRPNVGLTDNGNNFEISRAVHTVTILANDNTVGFAVANSSATEGETGTDVSVNVNLPFPSGTEASVHVDITNTATTVAGDYTVTGDNYSNGVLTLPTSSDTPNDAATLTVTAMDGAIVSGEGIVLTLRERGNSFPPGWELGRTELAVRFIDSEASQTIGFAQTASSAFEGDSHKIEFDVTGYVVPSEGFSLEDMGITGALTDAEYNSSDLVDDLDVTVLPGVNAGDKPHFAVSIKRDGGNTAYEPAETVTFTLPDSLEGGFSAGANTSHTLTIEASNNIAYFDSERGNLHHQGTALESDTSIDAIVTLFEYAAPPGGLPLTLRLTDRSSSPITGTLSSPASLSPNVGTEQVDEVEFMVPEGMLTHRVPIYIRDNATVGDNDLVYFSIFQGNGFPSGWGRVNVDADIYTLTVVDDDATGTFVRFSSREGSVTESSTGPSVVSTNITIDPVPTAETVIPVTFSGNAASYTIVSDPADALSTTDDTTGTITFDANQGSVELTLTVQEDDNTVSDTIRVQIDETDTNFPEGYATAGSGTWAVEVADKGPDTIGWLGYRYPSNVPGLIGDLIVLEELTFDINENDTRDNFSLFVVLKDGDGTIYSADPRGGGTTPHDNRYQEPGSINPPLTFLAKLTGSAYEDGLISIFHPDNLLDGSPRSISSTQGAALVGSASIGGMPLSGFNFLSIRDGDPELTETLILTLTEDETTMLPEGWEFESGRTVLTINILPNDNTIALASGSTSSAEEYADGETGTDATIELDVNLPPEAGTDVILTVEPKSGGTAVAGDYTITGDGYSPPATAGGIGLWTLPSGVANPTLTVKAVDDTIDDDDEFVTFAISLADTSVGWSVVTDDGILEHRVDFVDNDDETTAPTGTVGFADDESDANEVDGGTTINVPVMSSAVPLSAFDLTINVDSSADDAATQGTGGDFTVPANLSISSSGRTNFVVTILDDDVAELGETIVLQIPSTSNGLPEGFSLDTANAQHTVTILPSDNTVGFASTASATISENEGTTSATVSVDIGQQIPSNETARVTLTESERFTVSPGPGTAYLNGVLTLPSSQSTATFTITAVDNDDIEDNVDLTITMGAHTLPDGWSVDADNDDFALTITDDEITQRRAVSFSRSTSPVLTQDGSNGQVNVTISPAPAAETTIPISVTGDSDAFTLSATAPTGATWNGSMLTFPAGEGTVTLTIDPQEDTDIDSDRIIATLNNLPPGHDIGEHATWTVDIAEGAVGFGSSSVSNANEGERVNFTLEFSSALPAAATLTLGVSGVADTSNYTLLRISPSGASLSGNTLTVPAGTSTVTLSINIPQDTDTNRETVVVEVTDITAPRGWSVGSSSTHEISVADDDSAVGFVLPASTTRAPGGSTPVEHFVEITLPTSPAADVSLTITTGGTASYGATSEWFSRTTLPIVFTAGAKGAELTKRYEVRVSSLSGSGSKTATLTLSDVEGSLTAGGNSFTLSSPNNLHTVTINPPATIGFAGTASEAAEGTSDTSFNVPVAVSEAPDSAIDLVVNVTNSAASDAATQGEEGDFTVPATLSVSTSGETNLVVEILEDDFAEYDEDIVLEIASPDDGLPPSFSFTSNTSHTVTISANENTVGFASDAEDMLEESNNTTGIDVEIEVDLPALADITLNIAPTGTAVLNEDYTISGSGISGTSLRIIAGQSSGTITLTSVDDEVIEEHESIDFMISGNLPEGWMFGTATHRVTLVDNDVRIVSLSHDQTDADITHRHTVRMTIQMSAAVEEDVTLNITLGGKTSEYVDVWTIRYNSVPAGEMPPATFAGGTLCGSKSSLMCQVTLSEGQTFVDLNLVVFGGTHTGSDPTIAGVTIALASGHPSNVRLGDSSSATFTVTERCGAVSCN